MKMNRFPDWRCNFNEEFALFYRAFYGVLSLK